MRLLLLLPTLLALSMPGRAMQLRQDGDQLVLSGPVVEGDLERIRAALESAPAVTTVILRDSPGGEARTGYRVGELLRARGLRTAVSGFCVSSCSRMFLGGVERAFTDDLPPERTFVGFHGHYDGHGDLMPEAVARLGLEAWILRFTDGRADPALVHRWAGIGRAAGMAAFHPPGVAATLCDAPAGSRGPPACETLATDARAMGITTTDALVHSHVPPRAAAMLHASSWGEIGDAGKVPTGSDRVRRQYADFLSHPPPRAFALSADGEHFAWRAGPLVSLDGVLDRCAQAAGQPCRLYAVDSTVVWRAP